MAGLFPRFLIRVEALNLGASIGDTQDLSTIRGAGTACLLLPRAILLASKKWGTITEVFSGASQAVGMLVCDRPMDQDELELELDLMARGSIRIEGLESALVNVLPFSFDLCGCDPAGRKQRLSH